MGAISLSRQKNTRLPHFLERFFLSPALCCHGKPCISPFCQKESVMKVALTMVLLAAVMVTPGIAGKALAQKNGPLPKNANLPHLQKLYNHAIGVGTRALQAGQFDAALKAFHEALHILPGDALAVQNANRLGKGTQAMQVGVQALAEKRYKEAVDAFTVAVKLLPGITIAQQHLTQAWITGRNVYQQAMVTGKHALAVHQYLTAIQAFHLALQIHPGDPLATQLLAIASQVPIGPAIAQGLIKVTGYDLITIYLHSQIPFPVQVVIPPGSIFQAQEGGTQNMVVLAGRPGVNVPPGGKAWVGVACLNMHLGTPNASSLFWLGPSAQGDLQKLLAYKGFSTMGFRAQQFAIWTITDNPARNGYRGIRTGIQIIGTPPSNDEMEWIARHLQESGISPQKYRAFQQ
jgi:tetratricopeptide (TPR) repeat protein